MKKIIVLSILFSMRLLCGMEVVLEKAKALARQHAQDKKSAIPIIAIAGCSAVGKSRFTRTLAKLLKEAGVKATIFQQDDFNQPTLVLKPLIHPYFDYLRLHSVVEQIISGEEHVQKPIWNKTELVSTKEETIACFWDIDLVLFEGTYTLCDSDTYDFCKYSNYRVFINAPEDMIYGWNWEREQRQGIKARSKEKFDTDVQWDMQDYRDVILPSKKHADIIIIKDAQHNYAL